MPLEPGATVTIKDKPIVGFGKITVHVELTCAEGVTMTETRTGMLFLFYVFGVK